MKLLYCTDAHLSGKRRAFRLDNYAETVLRKFEEMVQEATDQQVDAVIFGGDMFDQPKIPRYLLGRLITILRRLPCPFYVVEGNHEVFGWDINTVYQTDLGILFRAGLATRINRQTGGVMLVSKDERVMVWLEAQEYHKDIDRRPATEDYVIKDKKNLPAELEEAGYRLYRVLMSHGMLLPHEHIATHTLISSIPEGHGFDHLLNGHYHPGHASVQVGSGWVHNIGAMSRTDSGHDSLERTPQYAILTFTETETTLAAHPFKCARPAAEVLDGSKRARAKERAQVMQEFAHELERSNDFKGETVLEILDDVITATGLTPTDRVNVLKRISDAEHLLEEKATGLDGFQEKPGVKIAEVEVQFFQSWHYAKFRPADGLNVIVGPSDNGKTALLRAIRWCLYNDPDGHTFITGAAENVDVDRECVVSITFTDGTKLTRKRAGKKRSSSGSYIVEWPSGESKEFKAFSHNPPIEIFNASQMPLIPLGRKNLISLNLAMQHDPLFMVQASPQERNALLGKLAGVQALDAAISTIDTEVKADAKTRKDLIKNLQQVEGQIETFHHLDSERLLLDEATAALQQYELHMQEVELLREIESGIDQVRQERTEIEVALAALGPVSEAEQAITDLGRLIREIEDTRALQSDLAATRQERQEVEKVLAQLGSPLEAESAIVQARLCMTEVESLQSTYTDLTHTRRELAQVQANVEEYESISSAEQYLSMAAQVTEDLRDLVPLSAALTDTRQRIAKGEGIVARVTIYVDQVSDYYTQLMTDAGVCPTCFTTVNPEHVRRHLVA